jgi:hypothetical protein
MAAPASAAAIMSFLNIAVSSLVAHADRGEAVGQQEILPARRPSHRENLRIGNVFAGVLFRMLANA